MKAVTLIGVALIVLGSIGVNLGPLLAGVLSMTEGEQSRPGSDRRMSIVLWDMFTGSAPYRDIFYRTLDPRFLGRFLWNSAHALRNGRREKGAEVSHGARSAR